MQSCFWEIAKENPNITLEELDKVKRELLAERTTEH